MKTCKICNQILKNQKSYCSNKCRLSGGGNLLYNFNKNRKGKKYEDFYSQWIAKKTREKISKATSIYSLKTQRIPPSRKDKKDSLETRKRKSLGHIGVNTWMKEKWQNEKFREETLSKLFKGLQNRPTSLEKQMIDFIKQHNLPYKYVGDGSFWIGRKNPDFININGGKKLIEVGNLYHHQDNYEDQR